MAQPPLEIALVINDEAWPDDLEPLAHKAVMTALEMSGAKVKGAAEIAIVLTSDEEQRQLNAQWRGKDKPTNVLSFPQIEPFGPVRGLLGDIVLARETVLREALEEEKSFEHHLTHLIIHGFLHILGHDHETEDEAVVMESLETQILGRLGIADPYADV